MPERLRITAKAIYDELNLRGIQVDILDGITGLIRYEINSKSHYLQSCLTPSSSAVGRNIADKKTFSSDVANSLGLPLPETIQYTDDAIATDFLKRFGRIVVKPNDAAHGKGVTIGITTPAQLTAALQTAREFNRDKKILLQRQIEGYDIRLLMIWGKLAAASIRTPATVIGDGINALRKLIEHENSDNPLRGINYRTSLNIIDMKAAERYLGERIDIDIPKSGESIQVTGTANIGTGGKATDITDVVPTEAVAYAKLIADELGQDCCGVDFIAEDIADPSTYYFIEINASPSFGLHMKPTVGEPRNVQKTFVDGLLAHAK